MKIEVLKFREIEFDNVSQLILFELFCRRHQIKTVKVEIRITIGNSR